MPIDSFNIPTVAWLSWREIQVIWRKNKVISHNNFRWWDVCQINICKKKLAILPVNDFSSWHLAKSQTFTVLSSEQEQNFKSVLEKLFEGHVSAHTTHWTWTQTRKGASDSHHLKPRTDSLWAVLFILTLFMLLCQYLQKNSKGSSNRLNDVNVKFKMIFFSGR